MDCFDSARLGRSGGLNGFGLPLRFDQAIARSEDIESSCGNQHHVRPVAHGVANDSIHGLGRSMNREVVIVGALPLAQ